MKIVRALPTANTIYSNKMNSDKPGGPCINCSLFFMAREIE